MPRSNATSHSPNPATYTTATTRSTATTPNRVNLIGGENEGWKVATTHLELEHGTGGRIARNWLVDRLFEHCKETQRRGKPLSQDPDVRERLVDIYIDAEIGRLFQLRNYWMRHSKANITYEGPQASYHRKTSGLRMAHAV
ncbi:MAG TPA: acyl-CoA dehydrogenase family protein, partial [Acidimicrobiia bacterium]|nr:acyl-CoA dehydrogenase family protein [Acidimicrobiia bacterium]